jgi:predicted RNase H-like HicB family nuclease
MINYPNLIKGDDLKSYAFTAVIYKEDNLYIANCPEVGTTSQGTTIEEALKNLQEATELYFEEFPLKETPHPILTTFEVSLEALSPTQ